MDTLDRFLLKEFFSFFLVVWAGLAVIFLGIDLFANMTSINLPLDKVFQIYAYKLPPALQQFVPVACLMATLMVLSHMSRQNEILALYSSGVGTLRLVSTFVALVAAISTVSFVTFDTLVPVFNKRREVVQRGLDPSQDPILVSPGGGFWYRSARLFYHVGKFVPEENKIDNLDVYRLDSSFRILERVHAFQARFDGHDWTLDKGFTIRYSPDDGFPSSEPFVNKHGVIPERPNDFKTLKIQDEMMRLRELRQLIRRNSDYGLDTVSERVAYHERIAVVFAPLVLVLLGIPFTLKPLKSQSIPRSVAFCFLVVFIYLLFFRMTLSMGKGGQIPPMIAGWAPNMVFLVVSSILLLRRQ